MSNEDRKEKAQQSFELAKKLYDELDASANSINTRAGIVLGLIASAVTASNFSTWEFGFKHFAFGDGLNIVSLGLFLAGTYRITQALASKDTVSPYAFTYLQSCVDNADITAVDVYKKMTVNFLDSVKQFGETVNAKGRCLNQGTVLILCSLGLVLFSRIF